MNTIIFTTLNKQGRTLEFKEPVVFNVNRSKENPTYVETSHVNLGIISFARTLKDLSKDLEEQIWLTWDIYALNDSSVKLSSRAQEVREYILSIAKETTATQKEIFKVNTGNEITINGVVYVPKDQPKPSGKRAVVVVDRGWIFAGDLKEGIDKVVLKRVVWLMRWEDIGFSGVLADPTNSKVTLKAMPTDVVVPHNSIIFTCPVHDNWGLELPD